MVEGGTYGNKNLKRQIELSASICYLPQHQWLASYENVDCSPGKDRSMGTSLSTIRIGRAGCSRPYETDHAWSIVYISTKRILMKLMEFQGFFDEKSGKAGKRRLQNYCGGSLKCRRENDTTTHHICLLGLNASPGEAGGLLSFGSLTRQTKHLKSSRAS